MAAKLEIYKCEKCGNIVEVIHGGKGELVCCGAPMVLQKEKKSEEGNEKHLPVMEKTEHGVKVKVGSIPHPMLEEHHIEWIEVIAGGKAYREFLSPTGKPEATFCVDGKIEALREYCNVHGLWKAEV